MKIAPKFVLGHIVGIIAFTIPTLMPAVSFSQEVEEGIDLGKHRIEIAGRQRMLSQRIAKAICYIELGYHVQEHHDTLEVDYHTFDDTLHILRDGGGELDLPPEEDRRVLAELEIVFEHWEPFAAEIRTIIETSEVSYETSEHVLEENMIMLNDMNDTVTLIEQEYANPRDLALADAVTLNIMSRQRMLSQKAAKDFCYVASGHHVEEERKDLIETQALFTASLGAIINGYDALGIAPPPTEEIAAQLDVVESVWLALDEVFIRIGEGGVPTDEDIAFVSEENNHLQREMNAAVQMYLEH